MVVKKCGSTRGAEVSADVQTTEEQRTVFGKLEWSQIRSEYLESMRLTVFPFSMMNVSPSSSK